MERNQVSVKRYYLSLYGVRIWFCLGWTKKQYAELLENNFGVDISEDLDLFTGECVETFTVKRKKWSIIVWTRREKDLGSLAHECLHAANFILARVGVKSDFGNDEAQTYLFEEIFRKALKK